MVPCARRTGSRGNSAIVYCVDCGKAYMSTCIVHNGQQHVQGCSVYSSSVAGWSVGPVMSIRISGARLYRHSVSVWHRSGQWQCAVACAYVRGRPGPALGGPPNYRFYVTRVPGPLVCIYDTDDRRSGAPAIWGHIKIFKSKE